MEAVVFTSGLGFAMLLLVTTLPGRGCLWQALTPNSIWTEIYASSHRPWMRPMAMKNRVTAEFSMMRELRLSQNNLKTKHGCRPGSIISRPREENFSVTIFMQTCCRERCQVLGFRMLPASTAAPPPLAPSCDYPEHQRREDRTFMQATPCLPVCC